MNHILRNLFKVCVEGHELTTILQVVFLATIGNYLCSILDPIRRLIKDIMAESMLFDLHRVEKCYSIAV